MSTQIQEFRMVPVAALTFSDTRSQTERRAHFDKAGMAELAASIKAHGVMSAILVRLSPFREVDEELYQVVAGERRALASKLAGLKEIPATVRDLTDEQCLELQLIENLQRQDLHELAEAEGYESLQKLGHSIEDMAAKTGKSKATIYARMKLLALCDDGRQAFYAGELTASVALLISRIPGADQQGRVLKFATEKGYQDATPTYRRVFDFIQENFLLKLSAAPFPREDADLVPAAGACGPCPMRTGNQPELFGDVKGSDVCTNPQCFQAKKAAHLKRELEKAKAGGDPVIRGGDARRILPERHSYWDSTGASKQLRNGFARPRDKCLEDPKKRTYAELAGKDAPQVLLQNPDTGRVEKIFKIEDIADRLKSKGIKTKPVAKDPVQARAQDDERRKAEQAIELSARRAIARAVMKAAPAKLTRVHLEELVVQVAFFAGSGADDSIFEILGWPAPLKTSVYGKGEQEFRRRIAALSEAELAQLAVLAPVISEAADTYGDAKPLEALAKHFSIDTKKLRGAAAAVEQKPAAEVKKTKPSPPKKKAKSK